MKRIEKNNRNNISYFPSSIKWGLRVALFVALVGLVCKIGASAISVIGVYLLASSILKIIRLSIKIIFSLLSILFLIAVISFLIVFIL